MVLSRRRTLIGLLLVAFALWPLVHHVVVKRYFLSPWRLFGWAMYCVPVYEPKVEFFAFRDGGRIAVDFPRTSADDALTYRRFIRNRSELGTLVDAADLGRILFRHDPRLDRLVVKITQPVYHYDSDRIRSAYFEYLLERIEPPPRLEGVKAGSPTRP